MLKCVKKHRQEQAQESRRKLMEAALTLLARKGYAGTNMRAISRGAGVADGLLYHYFPGGKQQLLQEIVQEKLGCIQQRTSQWDTELTNLSLEDAMDRVFTAAVEFFDENLELFQLVVREEEVHQVLEFGELYGMLLSQQSWVITLLEQRMACGELRHVDVTSTADTLFALITNYFLGRLAGLESHHYYTEEHCRKLLRHQCSLLRREEIVPAENPAEGNGCNA